MVCSIGYFIGSLICRWFLSFEVNVNIFCLGRKNIGVTCF